MHALSAMLHQQRHSVALSQPRSISMVHPAAAAEAALLRVAPRQCVSTAEPSQPCQR
jgi:hypothetical protein